MSGDTFKTCCTVKTRIARVLKKVMFVSPQSLITLRTPYNSKPARDIFCKPIGRGYFFCWNNFKVTRGLNCSFYTPRFCFVMPLYCCLTSCMRRAATSNQLDHACQVDTNHRHYKAYQGAQSFVESVCHLLRAASKCSR